MRQTAMKSCQSELQLGWDPSWNVPTLSELSDSYRGRDFLGHRHLDFLVYFLCRGEAATHWFMLLGTELHSCLKGGKHLHNEREVFLVSSVDVVPIRDTSFLCVVNIIWVMDQPQSMTQVMLIPVHIVVVINLKIGQFHLSSCYYHLASWALGDCICSIIKEDRTWWCLLS